MSSRKRRRGNIHIEYTKCYHEVLKYDEVLDIDIDKIYQTYLNVISNLRSKLDLTAPPNQEITETIINLILNKLRGE